MSAEDSAGHPRCSVVIRCYNEEQHIGRLLSGVLEQTLKDLEIIVVDSGSTDSTTAIASQFPVQLISIDPKEFSFGRALNLGCRQARGEFVVIASSHVYPIYKDWLERLLAPFDDAKMALVYGRQLGNESTKYSEQRIFSAWFPEDSNLNQSHPFCNNANAAIRKQVWEGLPYNEDLTGLEDVEWAAGAAKLGYKIAYAADAEVVHVHNESPARIFHRYRREAMAMGGIYSGERFGLLKFLRLLTANVASDYYNALREGVLIRNLWSILSFRTMQFAGTYRGYAHSSLLNDQLRRTFYYSTGLTRDRPREAADSDRIIEYDKLSNRQSS